MYYSPWKEDRFAGMEEEANLQKQGYVRTEESATCMVISIITFRLICRNLKQRSREVDLMNDK